MDALIPLFVAIPLVAAFLIVILGKVLPGLSRVFTPAVLLVLLILALLAWTGLGDTPRVYAMGGWIPENGIPVGILLVLDGFSALMLTMTGLLGTIALFYSFSYMERYTATHYYYALFCLIVAGMNGVVLSGDLFNLYVFLEVAVLSSYALVAFGIGKTELEASYKYQVLGALASMMILLGIGLIYWQTKTLHLADAGRILREGSTDAYVSFVQLLLLAGFGLKAAIMPFHAWLPDAHSSAPSPVSAILSGVLIKAAGVYVLLRLFFTLFALTPEIALAWMSLGALSMVAGSLLALLQWDLKRLLAYSSISQIGYVVLAMGMGMWLMIRGEYPGAAILALAGGIFHMANHSVFKGLLFLNAGALEHRLETRDLRKMGGLSSSMPVTSSTSLMASMSISGIPPFNGFFSKLLIVVAAIQGRLYLPAALAVVVSIITLGYFLKFHRHAFFNGKVREAVREVPFPMTFSMVFLAVLCLAMSLLAIPAFTDAVFQPAVDALMQPDLYTIIQLGL